jgi:hypothetical protein
MASEYEVKCGLPPVQEVVELLNAAYGDWGDEEMFEWKYSYPGTARDDHHLYISQGSKPTAFARLYHRTLNIGKEQLSVVVRGNAAVHPDYLGG